MAVALDAETSAGGAGVSSDEAMVSKARWRRLSAMIETGETSQLAGRLCVVSELVANWQCMKAVA